MNEDTKNNQKPNTENDDLKIEVDENLDDSVLAEESFEETVKNLKEKLKKAISEKQEYLNNWQRDKADFINARKRDSEEKKEFIRYAKASMIDELVPVLESFDMAFSNKEAWEKVDKNWRIGVEHIASQLKTVLENNGLTEFDPKGKRFDPSEHETIETIMTDKADEDHIVLAVVQKGYKYNGKVIKPAKVKVGELKK